MSLFNHRLYIKVFLSINLIIICFGVNFSKSIQITNIHNNNNNNNNNHYLYEITVENNQKNIDYDKNFINNLIPSTTNTNNNDNNNDNDNNIIINNTPTNNNELTNIQRSFNDNQLNIDDNNNNNNNILQNDENINEKLELRLENSQENYNNNNNNNNNNENLKLKYKNSPELIKENDQNKFNQPEQKPSSLILSTHQSKLNDNFWNFWKSSLTNENIPESTTTTTTNTTTEATTIKITNNNPFNRFFKIIENNHPLVNANKSKTIANDIESNRKNNELLLIRKVERQIEDKSLNESNHSQEQLVENYTENSYSNVVLANVTTIDDDDDDIQTTYKDETDDDYDEHIENVIPSPPLPPYTTESLNDQTIAGDDGQNHQSCILGTAEFYLSWWLNADGSLIRSDTYPLAHSSLDLSFTSRTTAGLADRIRQLRNNYEQNKNDIVFLSAAHNNLTIVPNEALYLLNETLQYLSLAGNDFSKYITDGERGDDGNDESSCTWSYFPLMLHLRELDIRHCRITTITENAFNNLHNLEKLFVAHNRIMHLQDNSFTILKHLQHLDFSYNDATIEIQPMEGGVVGGDGGDGGAGNPFNSDYYTDLWNQLNDPFNRLSEGLKIDDNVFGELTNLRFLDFSNTKITPTSTRAFSTLPKHMELLSLCYTGLPIIPNGMFNGTNLKILDISGNPALAYQLNIDSFSGINDTLEILSVQNSNIKPLDWLHGLYNLKILQLATNNINQLTNETFKSLRSIEILDLNSNHISNWYYRIFENNTNLKVLKLRNNNINIMTTEMFKDFAELDYLAIGENSFLCNCILREFIDLAAINNREIVCKTTFREIPNVSENIQSNVLMVANSSNTNNNNNNNQINNERASMDDNHLTIDTHLLELSNSSKNNLYNYIGHRLYHEHLSTFPDSFKNMDKIRETNPKYKMRMYINKNRKRNYTRTTSRIYENSYINMFTNKFIMPLNNGIMNDGDDGGDGSRLTQDQLRQQQQPLCKNENDNQTCTIILSARKTLNFTFQLLDFNEDEYTCINSTSNNEYLLTELENCFGDRTWDLSALRRTSNTLTFVLICLFIGFIIFIIIYYKWWYVRYFCIIIKNATILSFLDKDKNKFKNGLNADGDAFNYDVFVSYCQDNREWILEELLPNIERRTEINVCLHERDFQVGMSILENIISCMDRSRCLLLVVSQSFLLSQWCQFEMHLAQHRLLETRREHLILILLEDVPKRKRPKTLHYLMRTKTYIKWPVEDKRKSSGKKNNKENISRHLADERIVFWKRLRRALMDNDWENDNGSPA